MFSKKATKIDEIFTVDLTSNVKSSVKISSVLKVDKNIFEVMLTLVYVQQCTT